MTDLQEQLRDKDEAVLRNISEGRDDVQKITAATTLENHHVTYCFEKLEELDLIEVSKPDGHVERVIDGQKRVFQAPKQATLTEKGGQFLEHVSRENLNEYEKLSHGELIERVHQLENHVEKLEKNFEVFQNQVLDKIN